MRRTFAEEVLRELRGGSSLRLLTADLGYSVLDDLRDEFPAAVMNVGIAEGTMVGLAAGMSLMNQKVIVYSISKFLANKCFEFIREDICLHGLPVLMVGVGSGLSYGEAGYTHFSNDDIACLRTIPGLTILSPADPVELRLLLGPALSLPGPVYLRLGKSGEPEISNREHLSLGEAYFLRRGSDVALVSHGSIGCEVLGAWSLLKEDGLNVSVVSCPTVKPIDEGFFQALAGSHRRIYVVEEHSEVGGLGESLRFIGASSIAIPDMVVHWCGNQQQLRAAAGIDAAAIRRRILKDMIAP